MRIVVDSSTLISLAWAGQLGLLPRVPVALAVPPEVYEEVVVAGLARGHADAAAIESAIKGLDSRDPGDRAAGGSGGSTVDGAVLAAGRRCGALLTNDLALGRRAANFGVRWLRTADLVVLCVRTRAIGPDDGRRALIALRSAGRITQALLDAYLEEVS